MGDEQQNVCQYTNEKNRDGITSDKEKFFLGSIGQTNYDDTHSNHGRQCSQRVDLRDRSKQRSLKITKIDNSKDYNIEKIATKQIGHRHVKLAAASRSK